MGAAVDFPSLRKLSPEMVVPVPAGNIDRDAKKARNLVRVQQILFLAVRLNFAVSHQDDTVNFRNDVGEMMRDKDDPDTGLREFAHGFTQTVLRKYIQAIARFVE